MPGLLDCLERQTLDPSTFEILVVDPGADGTRRVIEERLDRWSGAPVRVLRGPLNGGPGAKRNLGAAEARGELLAFTDSDCLPEPGWLEGGLRAADAGHQVIQGFVLPPDGEQVSRLAHWVIVDNHHGLFYTANIFYARELFERLGGFTTHYYGRYGVPFGEDVDLGWRALRTGARFCMARDAVVRHPVGPPSLRNHLREQWLVRGFPGLVRDVPELAEIFVYRRWFLSQESARFTAAVAGLALGRRLPPALALGGPYARSLARETRDLGLRAGAAKLLSDATTFAGLAYGSVRDRRLLL